MISSILKNFVNGQTKPGKRRQQAGSLGQTECYESRLMLSAVSISGPDPTMPMDTAPVVVEGTDNGETIIFSYAGKFNEQVYVEVFDLNGVKIAKSAFFVAQVDSIIVLANGGDDNVVNYTSITDAMYGGAGNDMLHGGEAYSFILGSMGSDTIFGGGGDDVLFGADGDDFIYGGFGDDQISGNDGNDHIFGQSGDDTVLGGDGHDDINGGTGSDDLFGNAGSDTILGASGHDLIEGGSGGDQLEGGSGNDDIYGQSGNDTLLGDSGFDQLFGGWGADYLDGGDDNVEDELNGGFGADTLVQNLDLTYINFNGLLWPIWLPQDDLGNVNWNDNVNYNYS